MKKILIITGACGVGKTTIARAWAKSKDGATINCDYLTEWIYKKDFPHWTVEEEKFTANIASKIAIEYLNYGMATSIENVWSPIGMDILRGEISTVHEDVVIQSIWLFCELSENHRRDRMRSEEDQMLERVDVVNQELHRYDWPYYLHKIDTTNLTIQQILQLIEKLKL